MNCRINYLYEKFPNNPEFASHLEKIELDIWNTLKNEGFPRFQYEGINYFTLSPKMSKEYKQQMKVLQSLRDKFGSQELFLMKRIAPFDYSLIQVGMGKIEEIQRKIFEENKISNKGQNDVTVRETFNEDVFNKYSYIKNIENKMNYQKLTEEEKNQTVAEAAKKAGSVNALHDLAARVADRIGGKVEFENKRDVDYKGYSKGNTFVINEAYADTSTVIHEILGHPIINAIRNVNDETEQFFSGKVENVQTLYKNLLKELEYGTGKEVFERVKRDYVYKQSNIESGNWDYGMYRIQTSSTGHQYFDTYKEAQENIKKYSPKYTLEEQQEEAIVELLGMYTANKLDAVKDKGLITILKKLLKEMTAYLRSLFNSKEIEIEKLDASMTLDDLANLLAYTNSKLILPNSTIKYTTPDNQVFKTYAEASKHISELVKNVRDVDLDNVKINPNLEKEIAEKRALLEKQLKQIEDEIEKTNDELNKLIFVGEQMKSKFEFTDEYKEYLKQYKEFTDKNLTPLRNKEREIFEQINEIRLEEGMFDSSGNTILNFIQKNKEYEQSKEIIEEWKKVNNIVYNPEEVYSRGQEFVSVVGAYSSFDVNLMMQNLLQHIEDNEKAGGKFAISAFTKPIDKVIGHLEGGGGKIKFKMYPKSEDILWAANTDVYSGSVWDASEKVNKDKKSELLGVSYTKYPSLSNVNTVQPNLANIVDNLNHHHNELGISLNFSNFELEVDEDVPYQTKKIIENVNRVLQQKRLEKINNFINNLEKQC